MIHSELKDIFVTLMENIVGSLVMSRGLRALLVSAILLFWPLFAPGQTLFQPGIQKAKEPTASSLTGLLTTDADIDREISRIKAQVDKLLAESVAAGKAPVLAASPDEVSRQERLQSELVIDLDKQIDTLEELKEIRKDNASYELERKSWKGFPENPPFPIAFLDTIRDSLLSQQLGLQSFELRLSLAKSLFKRYDDDLKKSQKALRLALEASSRSAGTPREQRNRWLLDLAKLQNDRNETGLVLAELQRLAYETAVKGKRLQITFLEEKLRLAEASSPLSPEDLEKKLGELDSQRRDLEEGLLRAQKSEAEGRKKLDAIRGVLSSLPATGEEQALSRGPVKKMIQTLAPARERKLSPVDQLRLLRLDFEAEQVFDETARLKVTAFKARIQVVNAAEKVWQDRYWLTQKQDLKEMREKKAEVTEDLARLAVVKKFADTSLSSWMTLIKNQKDRIASLEKSDPTAKIQELILKAYEERQDIALGLIESIGRLERLINSLNGELTRRISKASIASHVKEQYQSAFAFVRTIWNTELYVATETTVVEDRTIVKPVSVTIGKVVQALIILFIGTWIAGKIGTVIRWALTNRLRWPKSSAEPVGKLAFGVMFIAVTIVSLVTVNIPLAVFAFLGGALAIGLGFGAQHLINNFISGMILLFGRSVRVGDIVEVDGQGGRVTNIGMRYSHIHRFDGIDMLVPNSQFLQHPVTNWTLSDLKMRYSVSIGVAYGSPTRETELTVMKAIEMHPMVLKDPPPTVLFEEFGDSALVFTGYFWMDLISNRDNRVAVSEIRHKINELFEKAGIVIAFPQRDVHVDSSRPFEVKVVSSEHETKQ